MELKDKHKRIMDKYVTFRFRHKQILETEQQVLDNFFISLELEMNKHKKDLDEEIKNKHQPLF